MIWTWRKMILDWRGRPFMRGIFAAPIRDRQGNVVGGNFFDISFINDVTKEKINLRVQDPGPLRKVLKSIDMEREVVIRIYQKRTGKKETA